MNSFIRLLYAVLIAVAVVTFVGVGVNSVYPGPKAPEYPQASSAVKDPSTDPEFQKQQREFDKKYQNHRNEQKEHDKKLSMILVPLAAVIAGFGLWYFRRADVIGEGVALGGAATSVYAVIAASMADHRLMRFAAVVVLLTSVILVVQTRFKEPAKKTLKKKA